MAETAVFCDQ